MFDPIKRAWALWVLANQSFVSKLKGSWGYERKKNSLVKKNTGKKLSFTQELAERLENTQIECKNALYVIKSRDTEEAFHYVDPPYFNSNLGHYGGYTMEDFTELLELLSTVKGKFLLSSYPSDVLDKFTKKNKWYQLKFDKSLCASKKGKKPRKVEVLTGNYELGKNSLRHQNI